MFIRENQYFIWFSFSHSQKMLLTKCIRDITDIYQLKSSSTKTTFSGEWPLRSPKRTTPRTTTKSLDKLYCCLLTTSNAGIKYRNQLKICLRVKYNLFLFLLLNLLLKTCCGQLLINVQNQVRYFFLFFTLFTLRKY